MTQRSQRSPREPKVLTPEQLLKAQKRAKQQELARQRASAFKILCKNAGLPMPVQEFDFAAPERKWRADFAWLEEKILLEVEGAVWQNGRHNRGSGFLQDVEKYNAATLKGYRVLRCIPANLCTAETIELIRQALTSSEAA